MTDDEALVLAVRSMKRRTDKDQDNRGWNKCLDTIHAEAERLADSDR